jgi:hypothetical protein
MTRFLIEKAGYGLPCATFSKTHAQTDFFQRKTATVCGLT